MLIFFFIRSEAYLAMTLESPYISLNKSAMRCAVVQWRGGDFTTSFINHMSLAGITLNQLSQLIRSDMTLDSSEASVDADKHSEVSIVRKSRLSVRLIRC